MSQVIYTFSFEKYTIPKTLKEIISIEGVFATSQNPNKLKK